MLMSYDLVYYGVNHIMQKQCGRIVAQSGLLIQFDAVGKLFRSTRFISKCIEPFFDGLMILDAFETYY